MYKNNYDSEGKYNFTLFRKNWIFGLLECLWMPGLSLKTICCPCVIYADNYYRFHGKKYKTQLILYLCCAPIIHGRLRNKIQDKFVLFNYSINTYALVCLLPCCALAQEKLELDYHNVSAPIYHNMI
jgi:Cys-rich protein (TIGR01571 family)